MFGRLSIGDNKPSTDRQANFSLLADVQEEQQNLNTGAFSCMCLVTIIQEAN